MRFLLLLFLILLGGCLSSAPPIEKVMKAYGMDVHVEESNGYHIYWEAPGSSPYDIIYGIYIARGACRANGIPYEDCTLTVLYGKEELATFSLAGWGEQG